MILALETATAVCGVALVENGKAILEHSFEAMHMHAEKLALMINDLLSEQNLKPADLAGIAVSIGPGSFTGLRIGLSTAKGLAFACTLPLVTVPTLKALALNALLSSPAQGKIFLLPLLDAKRDEVYGALYLPEGNTLSEIVAPCAFSLKDAGKVFSDHTPVVLLGDGVEKFVHYHGIGENSPDQRFIVLDPEHGKCSAASVGILGERMLTEGMIADLASAEPLYVKEFSTTLNPHKQKDII